MKTFPAGVLSFKIWFLIIGFAISRINFVSATAADGCDPLLHISTLIATILDCPLQKVGMNLLDFNISKARMTLEIKDAKLQNVFKLAKNKSTTMWQLKLNQSIDLDEKRYTDESITVNCQNTKPILRKEIAILFKYLNTYPPTFPGEPHKVELNETTPINSTVFRLKEHISDMDYWPDSSSLYKYSFLSNSSVFDIDNNGDVILRQQLDYESKEKSFEVEVLVKDEGSTSDGSIVYNRTTNITFLVINNDDLSPQFIKRFFHVNIFVNDTVKSSYDIEPKPNATDGDQLNTPIIYSLIDKPKEFDQYFKFNNQTMSIKVKKSLDQISSTKFRMIIKAYQADRPTERYDMGVLVINVFGINKYAPVMTATSYKASVRENAVIPTLLLQVNAIDKDHNPFEYKMDGTQKGISLNKTTGLITLTEHIEPKNGKIKFHIYAEESLTAAKQRSKKSMVTITIIDENDHSPAFSLNLYKFISLQTASIGTILGTVSASDRDPGVNGYVSYKLAEKSDFFKIHPRSGEITLQKSFNETKVYEYAFMVTASDNARNHPRSASALVEVHVKKENLFAPEFFPNMPSQISILESTPREKIVLDVFARDADSDNLTYAVMPDDTFGIKHSTISRCSFLYLKKEVDADTKSLYSLNITASDTKHIRTHFLQVTILGINDNYPLFSQSIYDSAIMENKPNGTVVKTVTATDMDLHPRNTIKYSILENSNFRINESTGVIRSQRIFNIIKPTRFALVVFANDNGLPKPLVASCLVNVIVEDVNDHAPEFNLPSVHLIVKEDQIKNIIYHLKTTDKDIHPNFIETAYAIENSTSSAYFELQNKSELYLKNGQESQVLGQTVSVIVMAYDVHRSELNNTINISITFKDMNNNVPQLDSSMCPKNIPENSAVGLPICTVQFSDDDATEENKRTSFSIVGWSQENPFMINPYTGVIFPWRHLDADGTENKTFTFKVRAENIKEMDYLKNGPNFTEATITMDITNVNDNPPTFNQDVYLFHVNESASQNDILFEITATDIDGDKMRYHLEGDHSPFICNPSTGEIKLSGKLDYDTKSIYNFSIRVTDEGNPQYYSVARVIILVKNMNDKAPVVNDQMMFSIQEGQPKGTLVGCIHAFDPDGDQLSYFTDSKDFAINSINGELKSQTVLDYEHQTQYKIVIQVSDAVHQSDISVTINVIDINDNQPQFVEHEYRKNITDFSQGASVVKLSAEDGDKNDNITFSLIGDSEFEILQNGQIILATNLDWRIKGSSITLIASAEDSRNSSTSVFVFLQLIKPAEFAKQSFTASVSEAAPNGTMVFQLKPCDFIDRSVSINHLKVDLSKTNVFYFDANCSCIRTKAVLDRETQEFYEVIIKLKDQNGIHQANLTINVTDVNDEPPILDPVKDVIQLSDNCEPGFFVIKMNASDLDQNNGFTYFLEETYGKFIIDKNNGVIRTSGRFNYRLKSEYNITVFVIDHGLSPLESNQMLTIRITDGNKYQPMFNNTLVTFSVNELAPMGHFIGQVDAYDNDQGINSHLLFQIIAGNGNYAFAIGRTNGTLWVNNSQLLDYEKTKMFNLILEVKDSGINPKSSTINISINVEDINDNSPKFKSPEFVSAQLPIPENATIFTVYAEDADSAKNGYNTVEYTQLNLNKTFSTDPNTGVVRSQSRLSDVKIYLVRFEACDKGGKCESQTVQLSTYSDVVNIIPVEEGVQNALVIDINATADDANVFYTLTSSNEYFTINSTTGIVRTKKKLVWHEENNKLPITVVAKHVNKKNNDTEFHMTVQVVDVNDHIPKFSQTSYTFRIRENSNGTFDISATDLDGKNNALLTYSFFPSAPQVAEGNILLNQTTGTLNINSLNREIQGIYTFNIMAKDNGNPPKNSTTKVTIELLDVNDNAPIFTTNVYKATIDENSAPQKILTVHADDKDAGLNGVVHYELQNKSVPFIIDQFTGEIWSIEHLDFETNPMYDMQILAIDEGTDQKTSVCSVSIQILDICDDVPQLTTVISLLKDEIVGTEVFSLKSSANETNYNISAGNQIVDINENTGSVFTKSLIPATATNFDLSITAWSQCNLTVVKKFEIKAEDPFPKTTGKVLRAEITENLCPNESIFNLSSIEEYKGKYARFELKSFKDFFQIKNGEIYCKAPLDREKYSQVVLLIGVTFQRRPITTYITDETLKIVISVKDINDHLPRFQPPSLFYSIPGTAQFFYHVGQIKVIDEDAGENGTSKFSISGKDNKFFYINPSSGELHILFEAAEKIETKFNLEVTAVDQNGNGLVGKAPLEVFVYDSKFNLEINVDKPVDFVETILDSFIGNLSQILEFNITVDQVQVHQDSTKHLDLQGSDILFHAHDFKNNMVSEETAAAKIKENQAAIDELLAQFGMLSSRVKHAVVKKPNGTTTSDISNSQVIIIVLACIIFVGCILGILMTFFMTRRVQKKIRNLKNSQKSASFQNGNIEFANIAFDDEREITNQETLTSNYSASTTERNGNLLNKRTDEHNESFQGETTQPDNVEFDSSSAKDGHPSVSEVNPSSSENHTIHQSPFSSDEAKSKTDAIDKVDVEIENSLPILNSLINELDSSGESIKNPQNTDLNTKDIKVQIDKDASAIVTNEKALSTKPAENGGSFILHRITDDDDDVITEL